MTKTGTTLTVALVLVTLSLALGTTRRAILGPDIEGARGAWLFEVTIRASGKLPKNVVSAVMQRPPDFRRQHIYQEKFSSKTGLLVHVNRKSVGPPVARWKRSDVVNANEEPFSLTYSFRCQLGMRSPTPDMEKRARKIDEKPASGSYLDAVPRRIESSDPEIQEKARSLIEESFDPLPEGNVRALFDFVAEEIKAEPAAPTVKGALACLRAGGGDSRARSRLLVALCRNRGFPARLITGLILDEDPKPSLHYWAEVWVDNRWLPMCPTHKHFGSSEFPENYLVFQTQDRRFTIRGAEGVTHAFEVKMLRGPDGRRGEFSTLKTFFMRLSLHRLKPAEQNLVRFLLLLPLAALVVSIFRTVIGIPTFGTFGPALLGLAFLDLRSLRWGLPILVLLILLGWVMRRGLERYHLLQVPRAAALLTLIVVLLVVLVVVASNLGVTGAQYVSLFPLVILTHLVERFWTVEVEDGTLSSFRTLFGTVVVSVCVSFALAPEGVVTWMFRYPETLGGVLAAQLVLGRYTGYRLSELYRFGDLIEEEPKESADGLGAEVATPAPVKETAKTDGGAPCSTG